MSITQAVLLFDSKLPCVNDVADQIRAAGHELTIGEADDLRAADGQIIARFDGHETALAFEYARLGEYDWLPEELAGFGDRLFVLPAIGGEVRDFLFAFRFQQALCALTNGAWWAVDFDDEFARPEDVAVRLSEEAAPFQARVANGD